MDRIGQPRNERSRRTRSALLDATWQLLEEQGAEQVTMGAVAARAGVSRRALYLHFSSRVELLLALHEHIDEALDLQASLRPMLEAPDPAAALEAFVAHLAGFHSKIMRLDTALLRAKDRDPDVAELVDRGTALWHRGCRRLMQDLADAGQLADPWTVDTAADLLWTFMFPDVLERLTVDRGWPLDRYQHLLTVLLRRTLTKGGG
jgi:AcrR family transcriptional regulator